MKKLILFSIITFAYWISQPVYAQGITISGSPLRLLNVDIDENTLNFIYTSTTVSLSTKETGDRYEIVDDNGDVVGIFVPKLYGGYDPHSEVYFKLYMPNTHDGYASFLPNTTYHLRSNAPVFYKEYPHNPTIYLPDPANLPANFLSFTTADVDNTSPRIYEMESPAENATNVSATGPFIFKVNETATRTTGNITFVPTNTTTGRTKVIDINSPEVVLSVSSDPIPITTITINLNQGLISDGTNEYQIIVGANSLEDPRGNDRNFAHFSHNFVVENSLVSDNQNPGVVSFTPSHGSDQVSSPTAVIQFDEEVHDVGGSILVKRKDDHSVYKTITVTGATNYANKTSHAVIFPWSVVTTPFNGVEYYIEVPAGTFEDLAGNPNDAIVSEAWSFRAHDTNPPIFQSSVPANESTVPASISSISLTYDEPISTGTGGFVLMRNNAIVQQFSMLDNNVTASGNTVTITGVTGLIPGQEYYVLTSGSRMQQVVDNYGNYGYQISSKYLVGFSTEGLPASPPMMTSLLPTDQTTSVSSSSNFQITFNESIYEGSGSMLIKKVSDNSTVQTVTLANISTSGSTAYINPPTDLASNTAYYIEIPSGVFVDNEGTAFAGIAANTWRITTADTTPPSVISVSPAANEIVDIATPTVITMTFSEDVFWGPAGAFKSRILYESGGSTGFYTQIYTDASPEVEIIGNQVILTLTLTANQYYEISASNSRFVDADGLSIVTYEWEFATTETVVPTFSNPVPAHNALNIDAGSLSNLSFEVSEDLVVETGFINIRQSSDDAILQTIDMSIASNYTNNSNSSPAKIFFWIDLPDNTEVYVEVPEGVLSDLAGNPFEINKGDWTFSTVEKDPPMVESISLAKGSTDVSKDLATLSFTYNEDISLGLGNRSIVLRRGESIAKTFPSTSPDFDLTGRTVTLTLNTLLSSSDNYTVSVSGFFFIDSHGNYSGQENEIFEFTVEDYSPPTVTSVSSTHVEDGLEPLIKIEYSEPVMKGAGDILLSIVAGATVETIPVSSGQVTIEDNIVTIDPSIVMESETWYQPSVGAGVFTDLSGNPAPSIGTSFTFKTGDYDIPVIISTTPANGTSYSRTNFISNDWLRLRCDENIHLGVGSLVLSSEGQVVDVFNTADPRLRITGRYLYIDDIDLEPGSYVIEAFSDGFLVDDAGNDLPGWSGSSTWSFDIVLVEQTITYFNPGSSVTYSPNLRNLNATISPTTLPVVYEVVDGPGEIVNGNQLQMLGKGVVEIKAYQPGNEYYAPAEEVVKSLTILGMSQTVTFSNVIGKKFGDEPFDLRDFASTSSALDLDFTIVAGEADVQLDGSMATILGSGIVTIDARQAGNEFYNPASARKDIFFAKADQTITIVAVGDKTYGDAPFTVDISTSSGIEVSSASVGPSAVASLAGDQLTINGAGEATVTVSRSATANYNAAPVATHTFTVAKKDLTATSSSTTRQYGESNPLLDIVYDGFVNGDVEGDLDTAPTAVTAADINSVPGSYPITVSGGIDANYSIDHQSGALTVTKADQSINFPSIATKTYGAAAFDLGATSDASLTVDYEIVGGSATLDGSMLTITGAGEVTVRALQSGNANYAEAEEQERSFMVNKKTLTVTADPDSRAYKTAEPAFTYSYEGFVNGDIKADINEEPSIGTNATFTSNVGSYDIMLTGGSDDNYAFNLISSTLSIEKADQVITVTPPTDKNVSASDFDIIASVDSDMALSYGVTGPATNSGSTISLTGDAGTVIVTISQAGNTNYHAASEQVLFEVNNKLDQTIAFSVEDQVYGNIVSLISEASSELAVSYENLTGPISLSGNTLTFTGAGAASITAVQSGDDVYNEAEPVVVSFTIDKASLTVTAQDESFIYGEAMPELTFEYDGFVNDDDESDLNEAPSVSSVAASSDAGIYAITLSGGSDDNYEFSLIHAELTIEKATPVLSIASIEDKTIVDDPFTVEATIDSDQTLTYELTGPASVTSEGLITLSGEAGEVMVTISAAANTNYVAASETVSFEVIDNSLKTQTITLIAIDDKLTTDEAFEVEASSTSELEVTLTVTGPASINGTTITLDGTAGTVTVTANQTGNGEYQAAEAVSVSFEVAEEEEPEEEILSVNPSTITLKVYPNPTTEWIAIGGQEGILLQVQLVNLEGRMALNQMVYPDEKMDVSHLRTGLYMLQATQNNFTTTTKILIH